MPNRLRLVRILRNKTQTELALEVGLSQATISNFEADIYEPNQEEKGTLAGALGVTVSDIFGPADVIEVRLVAGGKRDS